MTQDEIIEMAIEAEFVSHGKPSDEESELFVCVDKDIYKFAKLVAAKALAQHTWVGLTDEEIDSYFEDHGWSPSKYYYPVIKDVEAKFKEKNS